MQKFFNKVKFLKFAPWGRQGQAPKEKRGGHDMANANTRRWGLASRLEHIRNRGKKH